jgi:hypothetical protein
MGQLFMTAVFSIKKDETTFSADFRNWMENDHYPKMTETGKFSGAVRRAIDDRDPEVLKVKYTLELLGTKAWEEYQKGWRPTLQKEFIVNWAEMIASGKLSVVVMVSEEETFYP